MKSNYSTLSEKVIKKVKEMIKLSILSSEHFDLLGG